MTIAGAAPSVVIVGAGIVGAAIAHRLARAGAAVTMIDRAGPGAGATGRSFAWINANAPEPADYNRFRQGAMTAWRRLAGEVDLPIRWGGCLSWEAGGNSLRAQADALARLGGDARMIDGFDAAAVAPALAAPPEEALFSAGDGVLDAVGAAAALGDAAAGAGAMRLLGAEVRGFIMEAGRIAGVETNFGPIIADVTILAAGLGIPPLAAKAGVTVPVSGARGLLIRTRPVDARIDAVLLTPGVHVRQEVGGALLAAEDFSGAGDNAAEIALNPQGFAASVLAKLRRLLAGVEIELDQILLGVRPDPADGLPIIGPARDGLYVAVMHSGVTLAARVGELVALEVMGDVSEELEAFRLDRFAGREGTA